jgi:CRP-like cAMP-binding protein
MPTEEPAYEKFIKVYQKNDVIFEENSTGNEMYIVCSGRVKLYSQPGSGPRTRLAILKPGEFFGEMALVDNSPRSALALAAQDNTRLVVLDKHKFIYLVQQQPAFAMSIMETLCRRIREANLQLSRARPRRTNARREA